MKKAEQKSDKILIKAQVQSEWDTCNCAIVQVTEAGLKQLKEWDKIATETSKNIDGFAHIAIYDFAEFLVVDEDSLSMDKVWQHVEEDEVVNTAETDQRIDCHMIKLYGNGRVCWVGYGKHTGEEFWTDTIDINEL